jgi:hypothetical protein
MCQVKSIYSDDLMLRKYDEINLRKIDDFTFAIYKNIAI